MLYSVHKIGQNQFYILSYMYYIFNSAVNFSFLAFLSKWENATLKENNLGGDAVPGNTV